jgi:leader peptidase (prepilin peptidase) / N-methyltransferase
MPLAYQLYLLKLQLLSPFPWIVFLGGLCLGSFLNVCIYRLPRGEFWKSARSHCPSCQALLPWYLNIPVLSYLLLRGKARCCGAPIPRYYPYVELAAGLVVLGFYLRYPFIGGDFSQVVWFKADFLRFLHSSIDWQLKIIPDSITLGLVAVSPLVVLLHPELDWLSSFLGIILGGGIIYAIAWLYYLIRKGYGIGMGDAKLLAAIGGWLGYQSLFTTLFYGSIIGSFYGLWMMLRERRRTLKTEIPFGPFLALGAFIHMIGRGW